MAVAAIVTGAISVGQSAVNSGLISTTNKEDPRRFAEAQQWYSAAINGDADALCTLKHMSGRFGCTTCGKFGERCGHATQTAKDYDFQLYQQATQVLAGQVAMGQPIPQAPPPSPNDLGKIANLSGKVSDATGAVATGLGNPSTPLGSPSQTRETLEALGPILLIGVVVLAAVFVFRK